MGSPILSLGGWAAFAGVLLFYVRWVLLERTFFSGQDPENWRPDNVCEEPPMQAEHPSRVEHITHIASLGRPA